MNYEPTPRQLAEFRPRTLRNYIALRAGQLDYRDWLEHIAPAAACTRPVRLYGDLYTVRGDGTGGAVVTGHTPTADLPDGVIYKACGNRRAALCPACSHVYQRDAYHVLHTMLVGGKGVPSSVATHPAVFVTLTAPSFGPVHHRDVKDHTCVNRRRCDCRPEPCHPRRGAGSCEHGQALACWARHEPGDPVLGKPLCLDCYDHQHQVVWNLHAAELWRRTTIAIDRQLARRCRQLRIPFHPVATTNGKVRWVPPARSLAGRAAEYQARGAVHFHALIRLDGQDPQRSGVLSPPAGLGAVDLVDAVTAAATHTTFSTATHPDQPDGWTITWGDPDKGLDIKVIAMTGRGDITDSMVAGYLAKYATKSTEATGYTATRLDAETITTHADPNGDHTARLVHACWRLGRPTHTLTTLNASRANNRQPGLGSKSASTARPTSYTRLRRWAHMLGYGGHFLTKARRHPVTFGLLRAARITYRRGTTTGPTPAVIRTAEHLDEETTLTVGVLTYAGSGWHTIGDAALANTAAAMARARADAAREELAHEAGTTRTVGLAA